MDGWIERHRPVLLLVVVVVALAGLTLFEMRWHEPVPLVPTLAPRLEPALPVATQGPLQVYVTGAVVHPGVVSVPAGSIVRDALVAAGGASAEADLERINLAQPVRAASHVHVPRLGENAAPPSPADSSLPLNINTADAAALEALPGIGPQLAGRIVDYRQAHGPFAQVEDLLDVPGIGPTILVNIRDLITTN